MNLDTVKQHIESWIENFVEVPHTALGGWAPCPYAQQARLNKEYEVVLGHSVTYDLIQLSHAGLNSKQVIIIAYPAEQYTAQEFSYLFYYINRIHTQDRHKIRHIHSMIHTSYTLLPRLNSFSSYAVVPTWPPPFEDQDRS